MKVLLDRTELQALVDKVVNFGIMRECSFPETCSTTNNLSTWFGIVTQPYKIQTTDVQVHADPSGRRAAAAVLLGLRVRIPAGEGCPSLVNVVCRLVEVSAVRWSLVQRSHTDCGVTVCDLETLTMGRSTPEFGCCTKEIKEQNTRLIHFKTVRYMYRTYVYVFNDAFRHYGVEWWSQQQSKMDLKIRIGGLLR
jgi:hypothetical protein